MWSGIIGIILTGSRTIWLLSLLSVVWLMWNNFKNIKNKGKILFLFAIVLFGVYKMVDYNYPIENFLSGWDENGLLKRGQLNLAALKMIKDSPLVGVGLGNFLVNLPNYQKNNQIFWFQPVHNIILLLISEIGLLGVIIFNFQFSIFKKIKRLIKNNDKIMLLILGIIFLSGMVDHYWFTLPQNMWLLALVLGLM
jgi:O-antigen ligase